MLLQKKVCAFAEEDEDLVRAEEEEEEEEDPALAEEEDLVLAEGEDPLEKLHIYKEQLKSCVFTKSVHFTVKYKSK